MRKDRNAIQLVDLHAQQEAIGERLYNRIREVLGHGQYIMGPEIQELETELSSYVGVKHCITCSSGTDALLMALMAYGIGPGDAVFTTPFTFIATAETIALLGATPVFVDIDPRTFNIDPFHLESAIGALAAGDPKIYPLPRCYSDSRTGTELNLTPRGIIPVDLFGLPADYGEINALAAKHGLFVLEDAAQSFGASFNGAKAGALAHSAGTSFFPSKPLGCYGDGGALFTNDDGFADCVKSLRVHGKGGHKYDNIRIGINGRLDTLQAAVLLAKLSVFPAELESRQRVAERYSTGLRDQVLVPHMPGNSVSCWAQYSIVSEQRGKLQKQLGEANIPTAVYYPKPLHLQTAFSYLGYRAGDFPASERTSATILSLPMHPYLRDEEIDLVVEVISAALAA